MTKRELEKRARKMVAAMRAEGAKFPVRFDIAIESGYGNGPMSSAFGRSTIYGTCGCINFWSKRFFEGMFFSSAINNGRAYCGILYWPTAWRKRYQRVKTVRAQYRVMADFVEAEVLK